MTNTVETNEELIAKARELCDSRVSVLREELAYYNNIIGSNVQELRRDVQVNLNSWTTHLAEMEELEARIVETGKAWTHDFMKSTESSLLYKKLVTKVKRLLGVE